MISGNYYVYITTNPGKTVLYTGVTNDLRRRISEHYSSRGNPENFSGKYYCYKLIYVEHFPDIQQAIFREKEIKNMTRIKKRGFDCIEKSEVEFYTILTGVGINDKVPYRMTL